MLALLTLLAFFGASTARADVWATLARRTAKVGEELPLRQWDEVAERLGKSPAVRASLDSRFRRAGRMVDEVEQAAALAARRAAVRGALSATEGVDSALLRQLDQLDDAARETALVLAEGGERTAALVPDLAARAALLQRGGAETVAGIGLFGDDAARAALRLDAAIEAGALAAPRAARAARAATVADFGRLLSTRGEAGWKFWRTYVTPHWKTWLAGGALTALLLAPEEFMDTAGELTESGFRKLTGLVGAVAAGSIRGIAQGSGDAVREVGRAVADSYFRDWRSGLAAALGTLVVLGLVWARLRRAVWGAVCGLVGLRGRAAPAPSSVSTATVSSTSNPERTSQGGISEARPLAKAVRSET